MREIYAEFFRSRNKTGQRVTEHPEEKGYILVNYEKLVAASYRMLILTELLYANKLLPN